MKLYVTRHCQSVGNAKKLIDDNSAPNGKNDMLSEEGKRQAEDLAKKLEDYKIDLIIISLFKRTRETVEPYLKTHKIPVITSNLLGERNAGIFAGKDITAMKLYCQEHNISDRVSWRPENGESIFEVYERSKKFLSYLRKNFKGKNVLVCAHTNFLRCLDILIKRKDIMDFYFGKELNHGDVKEYQI